MEVKRARYYAFQLNRELLAKYLRNNRVVLQIISTKKRNKDKHTNGSTEITIFCL